MINIKNKSFLIFVIMLTFVSIIQELSAIDSGNITDPRINLFSFISTMQELSAIHGSKKSDELKLLKAANLKAGGRSINKIGDLISFGKIDDARRLIDNTTLEEFAKIANNPNNLAPLLYRAVQRFNAVIPQEKQTWADFIKFMVLKGADAGLIPEGGENILHYLFHPGVTDFPKKWIQYLISDGFLAKHPDEIRKDLKEFLIAHGANPEHKNRFGRKPEYYEKPEILR